jgi:hypothetical protein
MSTQSPQQQPSDKQTILAALNLLGVKTEIRDWPDVDAVEIFTIPPGSGESDGGLKFTLTAGRLTDVAARSLADGCDDWWRVIPKRS